jgi:hypothetical protein
VDEIWEEIHKVHGRLSKNYWDHQDVHPAFWWNVDRKGQQKGEGYVTDSKILAADYTYGH